MINKIKENIFQLHFKEFGSNVYVLKLKSQNILIDISSREARREFLEDLTKLNIKPEEISIILLTHSHWDHIGNLDLFKNAKVFSFENIEKLNIKGIKAIKTPGHTKDSLSFLYEDVLFSGDTLFHEGIGRTDFPESEPEKMQKSLNKLKKLKYEILLPGH